MEPWPASHEVLELFLDSWLYSLDEWSARRKASAYTGQNNTKTSTNIHASRRIRTRDPSIQAIKTQRTATEIGTIYKSSPK
jgi:hypothetical protein